MNYCTEYSHHLVNDHKTTPTGTMNVSGALIEDLFGIRLLLEKFFYSITGGIRDYCLASRHYAAAKVEKQLIEQE